VMQQVDAVAAALHPAFAEGHSSSARGASSVLPWTRPPACEHEKDWNLRGARRTSAYSAT
jgi:hypothetical protein